MDHEGLLAELVIDRTVPAAPYYQLSEMIRGRILTARLKPGDRLPAVREMAGALGISGATVKRALSTLNREGLIVARTGTGTFVAEREAPATEVIIPHRRGEAVVNDDFFNQILSGIRETFGDVARRCFLSYMDEDNTSAREILQVCEARRADGLVVYRPMGRIAAALHEVAQKIAEARHRRRERNLEVTQPTLPFEAVDSEAKHTLISEPLCAG